MPAVTTKFTDKDTLDIDMFEVNIQAQLDAGVHGIVLGGTLGEASTLLEKEKSGFDFFWFLRNCVNYLLTKVYLILIIGTKFDLDLAKADGLEWILFYLRNFL